MHCGGKKYSPSSSHASIISRVFHVSWFPKSKQKIINPQKKSAKTQHRNKPDFPIPASPSPALRKEARFYSVDDDEDDAYWRLSFREQRPEDKKDITGITPLSSVEKDIFPVEENILHCRKIKQKNRANNYSPKREFRVRVLEEMKKERTRSKGRTVYDSFAEVKTSFDPQQDFRDSMVEMICEKRIRRTEELEDLLACYLTLNDDEHHDLIIKVFQQVWFELSSGDVASTDPANKS